MFLKKDKGLTSPTQSRKEKGATPPESSSTTTTSPPTTKKEKKKLSWSRFYRTRSSTVQKEDVSKESKRNTEKHGSSSRYSVDDNSEIKKSNSLEKNVDATELLNSLLPNKDDFLIPGQKRSSASTSPLSSSPSSLGDGPLSINGKRVSQVYSADSFKQFLNEEFCVENLLFWQAVNRYHTLTSEDEILRQGKAIYSKFIALQSPMAVNIDGETRSNLDKLFSNKAKAVIAAPPSSTTTLAPTTTTETLEPSTASVTPAQPAPTTAATTTTTAPLVNQGDLAVDEMYCRVHVHVFDNAQQQIFELMKNDVFPRFLRKIIL